MAELSKRSTGLNGTGDDGWALFDRARAMLAQGAPITELTIGEHDIGTHPDILKAMYDAALAGHTGYAGVPGIKPLREAIAKRVTQRTGVPTSYRNVIVTTGGQAALFAAHICALDPGDSALFIDPYYATYPGTIRAASGIPHALQTHAEQAFFPDPDALHALAQRTKARAVLINSPNNPTGTVYPRKTLEGIANACQDNDLWLISDEVYDTQVWEGGHLSPRALPGMAKRTMVIGSMSKSHAMTGSRIGWIIAPEEAVHTMVQLANATTYGVPGYIQHAALYALNRQDTLEAEIAAPFERRRNLALRVLAQQNIVTAIPAQGAMYVMLDIRKTGLSGEAFANGLLDTHQIAVMPGESFGTSAAGHLRVALTTEDAKLESALKTLCNYAKGLTK